MIESIVRVGFWIGCLASDSCPSVARTRISVCNLCIGRGKSFVILLTFILSILSSSILIIYW